MTSSRRPSLRWRQSRRRALANRLLELGRRGGEVRHYPPGTALPRHGAVQGRYEDSRKERLRLRPAAPDDLLESWTGDLWYAHEHADRGPVHVIVRKSADKLDVFLDMDALACATGGMDSVENEYLVRSAPYEITLADIEPGED